MNVLDAGCGRGSWLYPDASVLRVDIRSEVCPDLVADVRELPLTDQSFDLVLWDPPHLNTGRESVFAAEYGHWTQADIYTLLSEGSRELARIAKPTCSLVLKWGGKDVPLRKVIQRMPLWRPLVGTRALRKATSQTSW